MVFGSVLCSLLLEVGRVFFLAFIIVDYHFDLKMIRRDIFSSFIHAFPYLNFVHNDGFCIESEAFAAGG